MAQDLVTVEFVDMTNYIQTSPTTDVMGIVMPYQWGPVDTRAVYSSSSFRAAFPEPSIQDGLDVDSLRPWTNANNAFAKGIGYVEIVNPSTGKTYQSWNIANDGATTEMNSAKKFADAAGAFTLSLRYPGRIPANLYSGALSIEIERNVDNSGNELLTILLRSTQVVSGTPRTTTLETHEVSLDQSLLIDGSVMYIESVLKAKSKVLDAKVTNQTLRDAFSVDPIEIELQEWEMGEITANITDAYTKYLNSYRTSEATMLVAPYFNINFTTTLSQLAKQRQDCIAVVGMSETGDFDKDTIMTAFNLVPQEMFTTFWAAREVVRTAGVDVAIDATSGVCGREAAVASAVYLNQLASAEAYGAYSGVLLESLDFDTVLDLHKMGINSIYTDIAGPQMFGIRTTYSRATSYWAKLNVVRITASILKTVKRSLFGVIHTPTASNPTLRAVYETNLNTVVQSYMPNNLKEASYADAGAELNNDADTRGGEIFFVELVLYFTKLVEEVRVKVIATDSSVTAEF